MSRNYVKVEALAADVFRRKAVGETNRQIAESYGLTLRQIEQLVNRPNRKKRKLKSGYWAVPQLLDIRFSVALRLLDDRLAMLHADHTKD